MSRLRRLAAVTLAVTVAGCGTAGGQVRPTAAPPATVGLATIQAPGATWAVVEMGGSAARHDNFWQLFVRPVGATAWRLVTPPGVASNGGLVLAAQISPVRSAGTSVIAGFLPSQILAFSPLAASADNGATWSAGVLDAGLVRVPDALAVSPAGGRLALVTGGEVQQAAPFPSATWSRLTSTRRLAGTVPGRRCQLTGLTAVSFAHSGEPLVAGDCAHPGVAGIFSHSAGTWQPSGPTLPGGLAGARVQVLRLTRTPAGNAALLVARSGGSAALLAAWSGDGTHWTLSAPLSPGTIRAAGFGASGAVWVLLASGQARTIASPSAGARWHPLLSPRPGTSVLSFGIKGEIDALVARGSVLTGWRLPAGAATWQLAQTIHVPIAYGSSG
ncbi:MAG TPA: hypothetical protein VGS62_06040 [Streptosporangiaceae bacterium]|nr:hypothetical protein [Streptosporangiaceae bacterium]